MVNTINSFIRYILERFFNWDPDFVKVTPWERFEIWQAERELERGETVSHEEMWKHLNI